MMKPSRIRRKRTSPYERVSCKFSSFFFEKKLGRMVEIRVVPEGMEGRGFNDF